MDPEVFAAIAAECAAYGTVLWLHFLGEPLLHDGITDMVSVAKQMGVAQVGLSTNGVALHGALADRLMDAGLDRLECSMDADDRDTYLAMRGRDHFARVKANVRGFLARKQVRGRIRPITSVQFMRTPEVDAQLANLVEEWRPWLGPRDFVMTIEPASFGGAIHGSPPRAVVATPPTARTACAWLFHSLVILQDGTVTMCGADWDAQAPLGNVRNSTIAAIWNGAEMRRRRDAHRAGRFAAVGSCAGCEDWRLADGHGYTNALEELASRDELTPSA
jgi:radical SAM protein with 4Fe4S-binding SPASM domain